MARALNLVGAPLVLWISAAWLAVFVAAHFWPASWWAEVRSVQAEDGRAGQPVTLRINRVIHRPFQADWRVRVWREDPDGWEVVCAAVGGGDYRPNAVMPATISLRRWTGGECDALPAGRYQISTTWLINRGVFPDTTLTAVSNVFDVRAP